MAHDVFISHSSKDKMTADAVCHALEKSGISCWIAPRDVRAGFEFPAEIMFGIEKCRLMVLIFSEDSNASQYVYAEVERAFSKGKMIIPYRLSQTEMSRNLEFFLSGKHWINAYPSDTVFAELIAAVKTTLGMAVEKIVSAPVIKKAKTAKRFAFPWSKNPVAQAEQLAAVSPAIAQPLPVVTEDDFFAGEMARLSGEDDGLVFLLNTPVSNVNKPSWSQFVFYKNGIVKRGSSYGVSPEIVGLSENLARGAVSEYSNDNKIITFTFTPTFKNPNEEQETKHKCRLHNSGKLEVNSNYIVNGKSTSTSNKIALYCGTYEDGFFTPNNHFDSIKAEIDKGSGAPPQPIQVPLQPTKPLDPSQKYVPQGVATITMRLGGRVEIGIANSLTIQMPGGHLGSNVLLNSTKSIPFTDIKSITFSKANAGTHDTRIVTNDGNIHETKLYTLYSISYLPAQLPDKIILAQLQEVESIEFDWSKTPITDFHYVLIERRNGEQYIAPTVSLQFSYRISALKTEMYATPIFSKELEIKPSDIKSYDIINAKDTKMEYYHNITMSVTTKNGEVVQTDTIGWINIFFLVKNRYQLVPLKDVKRITFLDAEEVK